MKWRILLWALPVITCPPATAETWAVTGARVWTMTQAQPIENATVVVRDDRIVAVSAGGTPPPGARIVHAEGRVVTPALVDPATQIGLGEVGAIAEEKGYSGAKGPLGAAFDVAYAFDPADQAVRQARTDGVAWAMIYPVGSGTGPFDGQAAVIQLGDTTARVTHARSAMLVTVGGGAAASIGGSRAAIWQLLRNSLDEARAFRVRRDGGTPRDQLLNHLDAEALAPVLARKIPLVIGTNRASDIAQAIALTRDYGLRTIILGGAEAWALADQLAAAQIPVILDPLDDIPDSYDTIGARRSNAASLARAGVRIAFSVSAQGIYRSWDAGPSLREGAGTAAAAGLPYYQALAAITTGAARIIDLGDETATLAPGASADFVVWDGDPLEPATAPVHVYIDGSEVSPVTRQTLLRDRYAPRRDAAPRP